MRYIFTLLIICPYLLITSGCGLFTGTMDLSGSGKQLKSQLEIRQIQTNEFQTADTKMVLGAMLNTLQDEGYMVRQINTEMGFFNAAMEIDDENTFGKVWCSFWWGPHGTWRENSIVECTANVTLHGEMTRVRANFVVKSMNNRGGVTKIQTIEDPKFYQAFFSKVDKGIFIEDALYTSESSVVKNQKKSSAENSSGGAETSESKNNNKVETLISKKNIATTNVKEDTPLKKCDKCGREIGKNETGCIFKTRIVCPDCFKQLSNK